MFFLKIKPFFRGYEVTGLQRLQGYEIAKSSIYLATTVMMQLGLSGKENFRSFMKISADMMVMMVNWLW